MSNYESAIHAALNAALHELADCRDVELVRPLMDVISHKMRGKGFFATKTQGSGIIYSSNMRTSFP